MENGDTVVFGSVIELTFLPAEGYRVKEVKINGVSVEIASDSYRFAVEEDVSVEVVFEETTAA